MVEVTQEDRDRAKALGLILVNECSRAGYSGLYFGPSDTGAITQEFAQHRHAAEVRGRLEGSAAMREKAAHQASRYREVHAKGWIDADAAEVIRKDILAIDVDAAMKTMKGVKIA